MSSNMSRFYIFLHVLTFAGASLNTGSHSLCSLATFIIGETPFPEFTVLLMVDDIVMSCYDSVQKKTVMRVNESRLLNAEEQNFSKTFFAPLHDKMRNHAHFLKRHFNHTSGVHVEQRFDCCELLKNNRPGQMKGTYAFNGLNGLDYNIKTASKMHQNSLHIQTIWPVIINAAQLEYEKKLYIYVLQPECNALLEIWLNEFKNNILRKVKPRVRILKKLYTNSGGARISCLATGFYPRHINLMLLRNNQSVSEQLITGGNLLPNGDGTYQIRKSLDISAEELQKKHNYTCRAVHLSLDNKLDVHFDFDPGLPITVIVSAVLVVLLMCVTAPVAVFIKWKKRHTVSQTSSLSDYSAASKWINDHQQRESVYMPSSTICIPQSSCSAFTHTATEEKET